MTGAEVFREDRCRERALEGASAVIPAEGGRRRADIRGAGGGITTSAVLGRAEGEGLSPSHWIEARVSGESEELSKKRAESEIGTEALTREQ